MADAILLENGVDRILLEDGSGVVLLEQQPAPQNLVYTWIPDTCPWNPPCNVRINSNGTLHSMLFRCSGHQSGTDSALHSALVSKCQQKNTACKEAAGVMGVGPGDVVWTIDNSEMVTIDTGGNQTIAVRAAVDLACGIGNVTVV